MVTMIGKELCDETGYTLIQAESADQLFQRGVNTHPKTLIMVHFWSTFREKRRKKLVNMPCVE